MLSVNKDHTFPFVQLNNNLPEIGKYVRTPFGWSKTLLMFDKQGDWKIIKLNLFQMMARRWLGCYQETRLKNTIAEWRNYQNKHGNVCPKLSEKLSALWMKKNAETIQLAPNETYFIGNTPPEKAEIIGIGLLHTDPSNSKFSGKLLSEYYREGDIILVEGHDAGTKISSAQDPQTTFLVTATEVYGWEPVGYKELNDKVFESVKSIENQFRSSRNFILKLLSDVDFLTKPETFDFKIARKMSSENQDGNAISTDGLIDLSAEEREKIWKNLFFAAVNDFITSMQKIAQRFAEHSTNSENDEIRYVTGSEIAQFREKCHAFPSGKKDENEKAQLNSLLNEVFSQCDKFLQKKKYTVKWSIAQNNFFKNTWAIRQQSLRNEIEHYRSLGKRVFVCAGAAHFFPNKGKNHSEVASTIVQHQFALAISNIKQNATYYSFEDLANKFGRL